MIVVVGDFSGKPTKKCLNVRQKLGTKLTLSLNLFLHAEQLLFSWLCSKVTLSLTYSLTLSFTLSRYAEQLLFSCLGSKVTVYKLVMFFWDILLTLTCEFRCHRAGCQLKTTRKKGLVLAHTFCVLMISDKVLRRF